MQCVSNWLEQAAGARWIRTALMGLHWTVSKDVTAAAICFPVNTITQLFETQFNLTHYLQLWLQLVRLSADCSAAMQSPYLGNFALRPVRV